MMEGGEEDETARRYERAVFKRGGEDGVFLREEERGAEAGLRRRRSEKGRGGCCGNYAVGDGGLADNYKLKEGQEIVCKLDINI